MEQYKSKLKRISEIPIFEESLKKGFPNFKRPRICGYFSVNKNREYVPDISQLKYFCGPTHERSRKVNYDLNSGIEKAVRKPDDLNEGIVHLLQFILDNINTLRNPHSNTKM